MIKTSLEHYDLYPNKNSFLTVIRGDEEKQIFFRRKCDNYRG
jgi:hypothetical protein